MHKSQRILTLALATMFAFSAIAIGVYFGVRDTHATEGLPLGGRSWQDEGHFCTDWFDNYPSRGTQLEPFQIGTAQEFAGFANLLLNTDVSFVGRYIELTANIDLSRDANGETRFWVAPQSSRLGTFNGNFYWITVPTVMQMRHRETFSGAVGVARRQFDGGGLFGSIGAGGVIENLALSGETTFVGATPGAIPFVANMGILAASASNATIRNVLNTVDMNVDFGAAITTNTWLRIGAVTGIAAPDSLLINIANTGSVNVTNAGIGTGGIVGSLTDTATSNNRRLINSFNTGDVTVNSFTSNIPGSEAQWINVGGLAGDSNTTRSWPTIENVFHSGNVSSPSASSPIGPGTNIRNAFYGASIDAQLLDNLNAGADELRSTHPNIANWVMGENGLPELDFMYRFDLALVNFTTLETLVYNHAQINPADYYQNAEWTTFQTTLTDAQYILQNRDGITQDQVNQMITDLTTARNALTPFIAPPPPPSYINRPYGSDYIYFDDTNGDNFRVYVNGNHQRTITSSPLYTGDLTLVDGNNSITIVVVVDGRASAPSAPINIYREADPNQEPNEPGFFSENWPWFLAGVGGLGLLALLALSLLLLRRRETVVVVQN